MASTTKSLEPVLTRLNAEKHSLHTQIADAERTRAREQAALDELVGEVATAQEEVAALSAQLTSVLSMSAAVHTDLEKTQTKQAALVSEIGRLRSELATANHGLGAAARNGAKTRAASDAVEAGAHSLRAMASEHAGACASRAICDSDLQLRCHTRLRRRGPTRSYRGRHARVHSLNAPKLGDGRPESRRGRAAQCKT